MNIWIHARGFHYEYSEHDYLWKKTNAWEKIAVWQRRFATLICPPSHRF